MNNSPIGGLISSKRFNDIEFLAADRKPCIVCGHETGDCTGETTELPSSKLPAHMSGLEPMILVETDISEERQITPYTKSRVLIHRKGDYVPLSKARELGLVK